MKISRLISSRRAWKIARGPQLAGGPAAPRLAVRLIELLRHAVVWFNYGICWQMKRSLSPREREIVLLCAAGRCHKEIAAALRISVHTVKAHLRRVFDKLAVHNTAEAVAILQRLELQAEITSSIAALQLLTPGEDGREAASRILLALAVRLAPGKESIR
jgi:DNA-binding CsgD family transcriptional regulator